MQKSPDPAWRGQGMLLDRNEGRRAARGLAGDGRRDEVRRGAFALGDHDLALAAALHRGLDGLGLRGVRADGGEAPGGDVRAAMLVADGDLAVLAAGVHALGEGGAAGVPLRGLARGGAEDGAVFLI